MSVEKTEALGSQGDSPSHIRVDEVDGFDKVKFTKNFEYLGADVCTRQGCEDDITRRIDKARKAFRRLASSVWDVKQLSLSVTIRAYRACVISVLLYGCETWTTTFQCRNKLEQFQMMCLGKITKIGIWEQERMHINSGKLREWLGVPTVCVMIIQARTRWLGHVARMHNKRLPKQMLFAFFLVVWEYLHKSVVAVENGYIAFDFVNGLEKAGSSLSGWLQIARSNQGSEWRQKVFQIARWYSPKRPQAGRELPDRTKEQSRSAPLRTVKRTFVENVKTQQEWFQHETLTTEVLQAEQRTEGRDALISRVLNELDSKYGDSWMDMKEEDVVVDMTVEWDDLLTVETDLGLMAMLVCEARYKSVTSQESQSSQNNTRRDLRNKLRRTSRLSVFTARDMGNGTAATTKCEERKSRATSRAGISTQQEKHRTHPRWMFLGYSS